MTNKDELAPINPEDSNRLKELKKYDTLAQRKIIDRQMLAIESLEFFSELYEMTGEITYLKQMLYESNLALKAISEILLIDAYKEAEDDFYKLALQLKGVKVQIEKDLHVRLPAHERVNIKISQEKEKDV